MPAKQPDKDEMQEYLSSLNLQQLDLENIDLEEYGPSPLWRWVRGAALVAVGVALFWLPTTNFYQLNSQGSWLFVALCVAAVFLGGDAARWLWGWLQAVAVQRARVALQTEVPSFTIPPNVLRWGLLLTSLTLGGIMLFVMPRDAEWQGSGFSATWFAAVAMALVAGISLGRWLIMQAHASHPPDPADYRPWVLPSWFKWATLAVLIAGGLFATFGHSLLPGEPETQSFALGGVGFGVGVLGAIWIARRFDEVEAELRARHRPPNWLAQFDEIEAELRRQRPPER